MTPLKQVGLNLKHFRKSERLRQTDLAEKSGVAYRHYQDIEAGKVNVSLDTLFRLAKVLKVKPHVLLFLVELDHESA